MEINLGLGKIVLKYKKDGLLKITYEFIPKRYVKRKKNKYTNILP